MKTFAAVAAAVAVAVQVPTAQAWWDNGHMLVGEVARQLMDKADVDVLNKLLSNWNEAFPNTDSLATAAIWPDLIKCSTGNTSTCKSLLQPSFSSMGDWHYVDLPIDVAGGKWGDMNPDDLKLFTYSLGGNAIDVLEKSVATIKTTKSTWSANLVIRNFIHIFGDLHQPLHTVAGVRSDLPNGNDGGGNSFKFASPCAFSNLHALWDAAGGVYSQNNWSPLTKDTDVYFPTLVSNASALIKLLPIITDSLNIDSLKSLSYDEFAKATTSTDYTFRKVALDSYGLANQVVYKGLDLKFTGTTVPCPAQSYMDWAGQIAQFRIALGGKRLAVFLTQFARQLSYNKFF